MYKIANPINNCNYSGKSKISPALCLLFLALLLFTIGCAKTPTPFDTEDWKKEKMLSIGTEIVQAMGISDPMELMIANMEKPNAWITEDDKIYFTNGMFNSFDDDGLRLYMAHEMAHKKLGHLKKKMLVSLTTTGAMTVFNYFVPGAGLLNYAVNPAVTNNFNKGQETEADILASKICSAIGIPIEKQVKIFMIMKSIHGGGGKFFDQHPSWDERIKSIKGVTRWPDVN